MAGELWRSAFQIGRESTPGTAVAATRKMYFTTDGSSLTGPARPATQHKFAVQSRASQRAVTRGIQQPGGTVRMPVSSDECLELYALGIQGAVAPSTGIYTYVPGNVAPDSASLEWLDGANPWREVGVSANTLRWTGNVAGPNDLEATLFGRTFAANALTAALTDRTPTFFEGWQTQLFIDALGATAGTTAVGALISWDITFDNHLDRKKWADNTQNVNAITIGEFDLSAQLTVEASVAASLTEFNNAQSVTARLVRVQFGTTGSATTLDIPGVWTAEDLGQTDRNTRVYRLTLTYEYDATNAFGFRVRAESARAAAFL